MNSYLDSSSNSIRHGAYISLRRRMSQGLMFATNYTFAKSSDDASDSRGVRFVDFNIIRSNVQAMVGAPRSNDRSVSTFDVRHTFDVTFVWDLPAGKGRGFFPNMPGWLDQVVGGWTLSGSGRIQQGTPLVVVMMQPPPGIPPAGSVRSQCSRFPICWAGGQDIPAAGPTKRVRRRIAWGRSPFGGLGARQFAAYPA